MEGDDTAARVSSLRATAHPLRLQMLSLLTGAEMSAAEIARELDITHANASYHLRVLAHAGLVVEAGEERIRGGIAKRYRHPWDAPTPVSPKPDPDDADAFVRTMVDELVRRFARRRRDGGANQLNDAEMWVTREVWDEVCSLVARASNLIHAEAKPPRTEGTIHVNMTAAAFEMADRSDTQPIQRGQR